jgi:hypothetical protein
LCIKTLSALGDHEERNKRCRVIRVSLR